MAESILKLRVDSSEYDSKIDRARQGLLHLGDSLNKAGKSFKDADADQVKFAAALGNMPTKTNTARGAVAELTKAYTDLRVQYDKLSDADKKSNFGKGLAASLETMKTRIIDGKRALDEINKSLNDIGNTDVSGRLFSRDNFDGMLQVFGGNLMTKAASMVANLGVEMADTVKQGIELAKSGEGIRNAFERLNRPDLLDKLKEATHGTVAELELMKQAVKFKDFRLNVEEMGTLLAFAQQKAKDTGQSVDYMVDSIVTGLGRQSLMILDNLGLSASEVKERMKETGDMTTAVASIIKEQMTQAGEYVETAADRSARAAADATNKMEDLGRTALPVAEEWAQAWATIKAGGIDLLNTTIGPLARSLASLQKIWRQGGPIDWDKVTNSPNNIEGPNYQNPNASFFTPGTDHKSPVQGTYVVVTDKKTGKQIGAQHFNGQATQEDISAWQSTLKVSSPKSSTPKLTEGGIKATKGFDELAGETFATYESMASLRKKLAAYQNALDNATNGGEEIAAIAGINSTKWQMSDTGRQAAKLGLDENAFNDLQRQVEEGISSMEIEPIKLNFDTTGIKGVTTDAKAMGKEWQYAAKAVSSVGAAMNNIEDPAAKVVGTIAQAVASVMLGYAEATTQAASMGPWAWIAFAAAGLATAITTVSQIKSATKGFADGGIVPGNSYSGDLLHTSDYGINSGELILNRAQQNSIASQLESPSGGLSSQPYVMGETILLGLNNHLQRDGQGEIVTTSMLKHYGLL